MRGLTVFLTFSVLALMSVLAVGQTNVYINFADMLSNTISSTSQSSSQSISRSTCPTPSPQPSCSPVPVCEDPCTQTTVYQVAALFTNQVDDVMNRSDITPTESYISILLPIIFVSISQEATDIFNSLYNFSYTNAPLTKDSDGSYHAAEKYEELYNQGVRIFIVTNDEILSEIINLVYNPDVLVIAVDSYTTNISAYNNIYRLTKPLDQYISALTDYMAQKANVECLFLIYPESNEIASIEAEALINSWIQLGGPYSVIGSETYFTRELSGADAALSSYFVPWSNTIEEAFVPQNNISIRVNSSMANCTAANTGVYFDDAGVEGFNNLYEYLEQIVNSANTSSPIIARLPWFGSHRVAGQPEYLNFPSSTKTTNLRSLTYYGEVGQTVNNLTPTDIAQLFGLNSITPAVFLSIDAALFLQSIFAYYHLSLPSLIANNSTIEDISSSTYGISGYLGLDDNHARLTGDFVSYYPQNNIWNNGDSVRYHKNTYPVNTKSVLSGSEIYHTVTLFNTYNTTVCVFTTSRTGYAEHIEIQPSGGDASNGTLNDGSVDIVISVKDYDNFNFNSEVNVGITCEEAINEGLFEIFISSNPNYGLQNQTSGAGGRRSLRRGSSNEDRRTLSGLKRKISAVVAPQNVVGLTGSSICFDDNCSQSQTQYRDPSQFADKNKRSHHIFIGPPTQTETSGKRTLSYVTNDLGLLNLEKTNLNKPVASSSDQTETRSTKRDLVYSPLNNSFAFPAFSIGLAYDIVNGLPRLDKIDPGVKTGLYLVDISDRNGTYSTAGKNYSIPSWVNATHAVSCNSNFSTSVANSPKSQQSAWQANLGVAYSGLSSQFAFTGGYPLNTNYLAEGSVAVEVLGSCEQTLMTTKAGRRHNLQNSLINSIVSTYNNSKAYGKGDFLNNPWNNFFLQWGTHIVTGFTSGGWAVYHTEFSNQAYSTLVQNSTSSGLSALAKSNFLALSNGQYKATQQYIPGGNSLFEYSKTPSKESYIQVGGSNNIIGVPNGLNLWVKTIPGDLEVARKFQLQSIADLVRNASGATQAAISAGVNDSITNVANAIDFNYNLYLNTNGKLLASQDLVLGTVSWPSYRFCLPAAFTNTTDFRPNGVGPCPDGGNYGAWYYSQNVQNNNYANGLNNQNAGYGTVPGYVTNFKNSQIGLGFCCYIPFTSNPNGPTFPRGNYCFLNQDKVTGCPPGFTSGYRRHTDNPFPKTPPPLGGAVFPDFSSTITPNWATCTTYNFCCRNDAINPDDPLLFYPSGLQKKVDGFYLLKAYNSNTTQTPYGCPNVSGFQPPTYPSIFFDDWDGANINGVDYPNHDGGDGIDPSGVYNSDTTYNYCYYQPL